jgi:hypothetical protein
MPLSGKPFSQVSADDLRRLQTSGVPEGIRIDYKRDNYAENKEFLRDISSFANSQGGYLLIGVEEKGGVISAIPGIPSSDADREIQRYENLVRDGLEPRIIGIQMRQIAASDTTCVLALAVPKSLNPPHRVSSQGSNKFYVRNSNGKHEASVEELRHLFGFATELMDRVISFVRDRNARISSGRDFIDDVSNGRVFVHVANASTFGDSSFVDLQAIYPQPWAFVAGSPTNLDRRLSLEGLTVGEVHGDKMGVRTTIFRDGTIESVLPGINRGEKGNLIHGAMVVQFINNAVSKAIAGIQRLGGGGPFVVHIAIETKKGNSIAFSPSGFDPPTFDRDFVELPPLTLYEFDAARHIAPQIRPLLEQLWNAVGLPSCTYFRGDEWNAS